MAYSKRYAGGFFDKPNTTTPIDSVFLNAVEAALLKLNGVDATADGQVLQWDNANTRFGPALLLNKNIDAAAAIDKSKLNLAGQITDADIAGAAAIAKSKLNLAGGIVNADINAAAAIALSKLASGTNDDVAKMVGGAWTSYTIMQFQAGMSTAQSIASSGALTTTNINTINKNVGGFTLTGGVATVPLAGVYLVAAYNSFAANSTGNRQSQVSASATSWGNSTYVTSVLAAAGGWSTDITSVGIFAVAAGATISTAVGQNSGGAINLNNSSLYIVRLI